MARGHAAAAAVALLLLGSLSPGLRGLSVTHVPALAAPEGRAVSLPCVLESEGAALSVVSVEWRREEKETRKLVVFAPVYGAHYFAQGLALQPARDPVRGLVGSHLQLPAVRRRDAGVYVCDITTFPAGSLRAETRLRVEGRAAGDIITSVSPSTSDAPSTSGPTRGRTSEDSPGPAHVSLLPSRGPTAAPHSSTPGGDLGYSTLAPEQPSNSTANSTGSGPTRGAVGDLDLTSAHQPTPEKLRTPGITGTTWSRSTVKTREAGGAGWMPGLALLPVLVLTAVAALICRRRVRQRRRDLPPAFKPPPPPAKYVAVRQDSLQWHSWHSFPVSKCNSLQSQV